MKQVRASTYVFTADPNSVADMEKIEIIRKSVKSMNAQLLQAHKYAVRNAIFFDRPMPKKPQLYRTRLLGRGPRKDAALKDYGHARAYDAYLPQRYAVKFDVYIGEAR